MNCISAELYQTLYTAAPHLHLFVDGQPLDELLHQYYPDNNYQGLVPTLLSWLDRPEERRVVWERAAVRPHSRVKLPLLMCPDDLDFSCTIVAAEVIVAADVVRLPRLGVDATRSFEPRDSCREMEWLLRIPGFVFDRQEYQHCLDAFAAALAAEPTDG